MVLVWQSDGSCFNQSLAREGNYLIVSSLISQEMALHELWYDKDMSVGFKKVWKMFFVVFQNSNDVAEQSVVMARKCLDVVFGRVRKWRCMIVDMAWFTWFLG